MPEALSLLPARSRRREYDSAKLSQSYSIRFVETAAAIPSSLWEACFKPPLEGRWWYDTLDRSGLDAQFTFLYGLVSRDGTPVGIAPAFCMKVPVDVVAPDVLIPLLRFAGRFIPSVLYQKTLFAGSPCAEEGTIGLYPGEDRRQVLICLQNALEAEARNRHIPMIVWKDFPESDLTDLDWIAQRNKLFRLVSFPTTVVDLPKGDKQHYFASLKASRRQNLKRKLRHSAALVDVDVQIVTRPPVPMVDEIFGLFWETYLKADMKFEELNRKFFEIVAQQDEAVFIALREKATGDMIAVMMCFEAGERLINKFIGIDYTRPKEWLLYFRLWEATVEWALAKGFGSIQSGQTAYAPKIEMGHRLIPLFNYGKHRNPILHAIYSRISSTIDWASLDDELALYLKAHPEDRAVMRGENPPVPAGTIGPMAKPVPDGQHRDGHRKDPKGALPTDSPRSSEQTGHRSPERVRKTS